MKRKGIKGIILVIQMDCHGSLHSPRNDQLPVIANEVKHSSFSHSSLQAKRSNLVTNLPAYGLPRLITFTSQWPTPRHCERSEAIQLLNRSDYQWIATAHCIRLAMTDYIVQLFYSKYSDKSFQSGFILSIKLSFFFLFPALSCFSLWIASSIHHHSS